MNAGILAHWRRWAPLAVLLALCILVSLFNGNFLTLGNFIRLLNSAAIPLVLCMGATFIILMGSIDLSVEGIVALTAVMASLLVANDSPLTPSASSPFRSPLRRAAPWASSTACCMSSSRPPPS